MVKKGVAKHGISVRGLYGVRC